IRPHPGTGREAAVAGLSEPVAVQDHGVAGGEAGIGGPGHRADQVDAGDQRVGAGDALPGQGHPVLVVQRGELDVERDLAVQQGLVGLLEQARGGALGVDQDRAHGGAPLGSLLTGGLLATLSIAGRHGTGARRGPKGAALLAQRSVAGVLPALATTDRTMLNRGENPCAVTQYVDVPRPPLTDRDDGYRPW